MWLWAFPFALQGLAIGADELWFHRKRGLPLWERIGHPFDTASLLLALTLPLAFPYGEGILRTFALIAVASCLLITKDEYVHARHCTPAEHWLHALLFMLHPVVLIEVAWLWRARDSGVLTGAEFLLRTQWVGVGIFLLYQIVSGWKGQAHGD